MTLFLFILAAIAIYYFFVYRDGSKSRNITNNRKICPNCKNPVEENYRVCPICKETLKKRCDGCGETINIQWKYCPYCEKPTKKSEEQ